MYEDEKMQDELQTADQKEVDSPRFVSLAVKNAMVYFVLTLFGFALLAAVLFRYSAQEIIASSEQQVQEASNLVNVKFTSFIQNVRRDIVYLAQSPFLHDFIQESSLDKRELLSKEYLALLTSKPDYAQIRLIGIENSGAELIRTERLRGTTVLVAEEDLQQKGERPYFVETSQLPRDSVYLSAIDLNKEYGAISLPRMPTMRVATPVFRDENLFGIVIINVNLEPLFDELAGLVQEGFNLKLVNQEGHFLLHPNEESTFGFEYEKAPPFATDFGVPFAMVQPQVAENGLMSFASEELLYFIQALFYPKNDYQLFVAVGASKKAILATFYAWRKNILLASFALAVLILLAILLYMRRQAQELRRITDTMTAYPLQTDWEELPENRNDEIGRLARRFREMSEAIEENISALKVAKQEVEEAVEEKEEFLENMSHEIRNPIHSMIGMTHLLEKNNPGRHQEAFIEALKFNAGNLLSLVNDILDYKKLSSGALAFKPEWVELRPFLQQIVSSHQFSSAKKKIKLSLEVDPRLDSSLLWFDPIRLTQVVNNLVVNALKFTPESGEVRIKASLQDSSKGLASVQLEVEDTGIGIPKEEVDKIIRRYYSQTAVDEVGPTGMGLGLSIVIQLLKLFNSELVIESEPGVGSVFRFGIELAVKEAAPSSDDPQAAQLSLDLLKEARVLVMDDDPLIIHLYENLLSETVGHFAKLHQLAQMAELDQAQFDIVITDQYFGPSTILEQRQQLREILAPDGLLFLLTGAESIPEAITTIPQYAGLFTKPVDPQELTQVVLVAFAKARFGRPDLARFWEDYDQDEVAFRRVIKLLQREWADMMRGLDTAIGEQDMQAYLAIRHKLITSVRRLRLAKFEPLLDEPIPDKVSQLTPAFRERLLQRMNFYLWWLRWKV